MKHVGRRSVPPVQTTGRGRRRNRPKRRHTIAKVLASSLIALALVTGVGVTYLYEHLNGNVQFDPIADQLKNRPVDVGPKGALNILVLGSDTRVGKGNALDGEGGGGSDTTILMHLSADRRSAYGVSVPRDLLVDRPDCTAKNGDTIPGADNVMWNAAYNVGGPACTQQQFEQLTGIRVDNYVVVDFSGFKNMVDAVGGVEICVPEEIDDSFTGLKLQPGTQNIKGNEALSYVRLRHGVGDGSDIGRIKRQQAFVAAMAAKVVSGGTLANPAKVVGFLNAATKSLVTDFGNLFDLGKVGNQFNGVGLKRIQFITVPFEYSTEQPGRVVLTATAADLWNKINNDSSLGTFRAGAISADKVPGQSASSSPSASSSASESPSTSSPSESPSPSTGLDPDQLASVGLCG